MDNLRDLEIQRRLSEELEKGKRFAETLWTIGEFIVGSLSFVCKLADIHS
jgi:hypothetical protein